MLVILLNALIVIFKFYASETTSKEVTYYISVMMDKVDNREGTKMYKRDENYFISISRPSSPL